MTQSVDLTRRPFLPTELMLLTLVAAMACMAVASAVLSGRMIALSGFTTQAACALFLLLVGGALRQFWGAERLALLLIACATMLGFIAGTTLFVAQFFPLGMPLVDPGLATLDAAIGADALSPGAVLAAVAAVWQHFVPFVFMVSLVALAMTRRGNDLHRMLLAGALALCGAVGIWAVAPSFGPLGPNAMQQALAGPGADVVRAIPLRGLFSFPSLDMVMVLLAAWFARRTALAPAFIGFAVLSVPMILASQSNYAVDLLGGGALFWAAASLAGLIINPAGRGPGFQRRNPRVMG